MGLVLSRKKDEVIRIGDDISVMVIEIQGSDKVRLLIDAPKDIPVHREEVYQAIKRDKGAGHATDAVDSKPVPPALSRGGQ
jgi:carbon storage regulator